MSTSSSVDKELFLCSKENDWTNSVESILTQKIGKLVKSESLFKFSKNYNINLTLSELELRECHLKNLKLKQNKGELVQDKPNFSRTKRAKSSMKEELEILKINMSAQEKMMRLGESQRLLIKFKKKGKKNRDFIQYLERICRKCILTKVKDLLSEIEGSESAKTDTVVWKFLKRSSSFKKEFIMARQLIIELQAMHFPGLACLSDSRFHNTLPVKITCPNCRFYVTTSVKQISTVKTRLTSLILGLFGFCFVPRLIYAFKDSVHLCPLCKIYLGFCPAFGIRDRRRSLNLFKKLRRNSEARNVFYDKNCRNMVSASSTSAKNLFVESKLRLSDRVQVNVNNIAAITRQIQRGSKANENLLAAAKNFALQEAAIENSETNLKKLKLLLTHINNQLDSIHKSTSKMELVLEQVRSMQR